MNSALITALSLCSLSGISISGSGSQTVEVRPGEEVTLMCPNVSEYHTLTYWFRLVDSTSVSCIAVMFNSLSSPSYCDEIQNGKFEMTTNISTIFLKIKQADLSDSGLYFCGFYADARPRFTVTQLNVEGLLPGSSNSSDSITKLMSVILGALTVFLINVIIGLAVKIRKLQTAADEGQKPQQTENLDSDVAALSLYSATIRSRRPASDSEVETHILYTAK